MEAIDNKSLPSDDELSSSEISYSSESDQERLEFIKRAKLILNK